MWSRPNLARIGAAIVCLCLLFLGIQMARGGTPWGGRLIGLVVGSAGYFVFLMYQVVEDVRHNTKVDEP